MMEEKDLSFYLYLQKRLLDNADKGKRISYTNAKTCIHRSRIPLILFPVLAKELEAMGLIVREDRWTIKVINEKKSEKIQKNMNRVYHDVGIF